MPLSRCTYQKDNSSHNVNALQHWDHANESYIHIPFEREYMINETPGHHIYKQFVGGFLLFNSVPVYLRSFGVLNLTLWDDVMGEFMPLTSNDIIIAGEHEAVCAILCPTFAYAAHAIHNQHAPSASKGNQSWCGCPCVAFVPSGLPCALVEQYVHDIEYLSDVKLPYLSFRCRVWGMVPTL